MSKCPYCLPQRPEVRSCKAQLLVTVSRLQDDYWDEEDELEEYIMKKDLGQIKERSGTGSDSSHSDSEGTLCLRIIVIQEDWCSEGC